MCGLVQELCGRGQGVDLRLEFLLAEDVAAYVAGRLGGPVAAPLTAFVFARVRDHRAASVGCQLSQRSHRPDAFSPHQWLLTSRIGTPFALFQLLVFLP